MDRRESGVTLAVCPCQIAPLKMIIVPRSPQPKTSPEYFARASDNRSHGRWVQLCDVGTKRVAPLSSRNESIMRMDPSKGASSEPRAKSACSSCGGVPPLRVLAKNELSLNGSPMMWLQASRRGG